MLTAKYWRTINRDTHENVCIQTFHRCNDNYWIHDVLYCICGAIIGDRNDAIAEGYQVWYRTRRRLGLTECKCHSCLDIYGDTGECWETKTMGGK